MNEQNPFIEETQQYVQQMKSGLNSILVTVRVRPLNKKQKMISQIQTVKVLDSKLLILNDPESNNSMNVLRKNRTKDNQFAFDYVFDHQVATEQIYDKVVSVLLDGVFEGYNATVLAYGATSCGKTYTMIGQNQKTGIMALSIIDILNRAKEIGKHKIVKFKASYIEIYNENIKDLLISEDKNFQLREDPKQGITIAGITQVTINSINELKAILKVGARNRTKQSTGSNQFSSRSHAILQIQVETKDKAQSTVDESNISKLSLVDLAGSERASNTTNKGQRMVEGAKINQSLLILGNCIQALSQGSEKGLKNVFVPYRGSKLTRLLKDSLGGNCRTIMIAHVTPASFSFQETYNTIVYANRAKSIKNNAIRNTLNSQTHITNYVNVINVLKKENEELKQQLMNKLQSPGNNKPLPLLQNSAYDEQIRKYEENIKHFYQRQSDIIQKIAEIEDKIQVLAFQIFAQQLQKSKSKSLKQKALQAASLSKQKLKYQKKIEDIQLQIEKLTNQIKQNDILGKIGQQYMVNFLRVKKIQVHDKKVKLRQEALENEKKSISNFLKKIKKHLEARDKIIEAQKIVIKKNNIISRITYSQLDFHTQKNQENYETSRGKQKIESKNKESHQGILRKNYSVMHNKTKKNISYPFQINSETQDINQSYSLNKISVQNDKKTPRTKNQQNKPGVSQKHIKKTSQKKKKMPIRISQDTSEDGYDENSGLKIDNRSPKLYYPRNALKSSPKKLKNKLQFEKEDLSKKYKKNSQVNFDCVFMPH